MPKPRRGVIPTVRLRDAREVKNMLIHSIVQPGVKVVLTLYEGSFAVAIRRPYGLDFDFSVFGRQIKGVPIKIEDIVVRKPSR